MPKVSTINGDKETFAIRMCFFGAEYQKRHRTHTIGREYLERSWEIESSMLSDCRRTGGTSAFFE